jgi:hypothetical protein
MVRTLGELAANALLVQHKIQLPFTANQWSQIVPDQLKRAKLLRALQRFLGLQECAVSGSNIVSLSQIDKKPVPPPQSTPMKRKSEVSGGVRKRLLGANSPFKSPLRTPTATPRRQSLSVLKGGRTKELDDLRSKLRKYHLYEKNNENSEPHKLDGLIRKWRDVCRNALSELQSLINKDTGQTYKLSQLANNLHVPIETLGNYDDDQDDFVDT